MVCPDCLAELDAQQESCASCGYVRPSDGWTPDPLTGLIVGGRYRLEGRIGAGGMASVFRASRIGALGGQVAVKVLAPRFARTVIARRFEREAQVVARLTNPHVVRVYDFDSFSFVPAGKGAREQSLYYIAMELIDGQTLGQLLRAQGKVNFLWGIDILRQLARGLEEAHAQGIVHRDLKPSNIILVQQRGSTHLKILDFGIAALSVSDQASSGQDKLTQTGFVSGTPDYMAPEQAVGDPTIGTAADMFAIGVIAFEMFSGRKPFEGATMESLLARVTKGAPALREVMTDASFPPELFRIVDKLLERDPKLRYQNAGELLDDLGRFPTLQTTPDFVPPAELLLRYASSSSEPAYSGPASSLVGVGSGAGAIGQSTRTVHGVGAALAGTGTAAKKKSTWWVWLLALLILGGAAAAVAVVLMKGPPVVSGPPTPTEVKAETPFLEGPRPALEPGLRATTLTLGRDVIAIAEATEAGPLYRPIALRVALDRDGKPMRIVRGALAVKLVRGAVDIGTVDGEAGADGRLAIALPPRAVADTFAVTLELTLGGGERYEVRLTYDARSGSFSLSP